MSNVSRSALVAYSADSMFDLINDVQSYPEFIPGCAETKVLEQTEDMMRASILISKAGVKQWFTTSNSLLRGESIQMDLVDGPFSKLSGGWTIKALSDSACKIELNLDFAFSSKLVEMAFGRVFNAIAGNMVVAFTDRAKQIYG
ncbi:type II toxin-antitoxin system RatA family toxin [Paraglaciecola aquimarina]|uniref:Type II toxin-antitoxin system RatA family toxin n=1 Tax=Paraglaciecola aquimarina TaxID=1235557 RepID=A0ABU3SXG3_9ALTE|nr:type II toxin-antitoxin system RatA family toxin [Paraglaciecola aquimarina]MDU0354706.1 type II toxin-antitoxin system RatA family toxin [Paraglaciecola aquimarina]